MSTARETREDRARQQIIDLLVTIRWMLVAVLVVIVAVGTLAAYNRQVMGQVRDQLRGKRTTHILCAYLRDTEHRTPPGCEGL